MNVNECQTFSGRAGGEAAAEPWLHRHTVQRPVSPAADEFSPPPVLSTDGSALKGGK